ncbi:MAG: hypothetical protein COC12_07525 [Rhodobacteraceae bacterium]|nr:MAG: hypothetical protein COC12_07525 [Paracoccaceae bacterium]
MRFTWSGRFLPIAFLVLVALAIALAWGLGWVDFSGQGLSAETIQQWVAQAGAFGPVIVILLMIIAVVASPIPSAPIALAAGAAYGHTYGTFYVVAGAETGALIAFWLGRKLGRDVLLRWFGDKVDMGLLGSQNALMGTVLLTRLMPFVSFDLVSYAAGLSRLHAWRFALATFAGIIPASFLLAHLGGEFSGADLGRTAWAVLGLGMITGAPFVIAFVYGKFRKNGKDRQT